MISYDPQIETDADKRCQLSCASVDELATVLAEAGVDEVQRMFGRNYILPLYHIVGDEPVPHVKHLFEYCSTAQFEADLDWYLERFTPVGLDDILAHVNGKGTLPDNFMHLTIDDGMREAGEVIAPLLLKKGIPATLFVCPNFVDNTHFFYRHRASCLLEAADNLPETARAELNAWGGEEGFRKAVLSISWAERERLDQPAEICGFDDTEYLRKNRPYLTKQELLDLMDDGFTVGAHSMSHPLYKVAGEEEGIYQTRQSLQWVRTNLDPNCRTFSFPFNEIGMEHTFFDALSPDLDAMFGLTFFSPRGLAKPLIQRCPMDRADRFALEPFLAKWFAHYHWSQR